MPRNSTINSSLGTWMSNPHNSFYSPPQTPTPHKHSVDKDSYSSDTNSTVRITAFSSSIVSLRTRISSYPFFLSHRVFGRHGLLRPNQSGFIFSSIHTKSIWRQLGNLVFHYWILLPYQRFIQHSWRIWRKAVTLRAFYRRKKNSAGIIVRKISDLIW